MSVVAACGSSFAGRLQLRCCRHRTANDRQMRRMCAWQCHASPSVAHQQRPSLTMRFDFHRTNVPSRKLPQTKPVPETRALPRRRRSACAASFFPRRALEPGAPLRRRALMRSGGKKRGAAAARAVFCTAAVVRATRCRKRRGDSAPALAGLRCLARRGRARRAAPGPARRVARRVARRGGARAAPHFAPLFPPSLREHTPRATPTRVCAPSRARALTRAPRAPAHRRRRKDQGGGHAQLRPLRALSSSVRAQPVPPLTTLFPCSRARAASDARPHPAAARSPGPCRAPRPPPRCCCC
jgi:hypothetical protein